MFQPTIIVSKVEEVRVDPPTFTPTILQPNQKTQNINNVRVGETNFTPVSPTPVKIKTQDITHPASFKPTPMKGQVRKSLEPNELNLDSRYPSVDATVMALLKKRVSEIVLETLTTMDCDKIGNELQSRFNAILTNSITVTQNPNLKNGQRHLGRLRQILAEALYDLENGRGFLRRKVDSNELLSRLSVEVDQLKSIMAVCIDETKINVDGLKRFSIQLNSLSTEIDAEILLIEVLMDLVSEDHKNILVRRGISITQTLTQIKTQYAIYDGILQSMEELSQSMYNAVYVQVPSMLQCIMTNTMSEMTDTQKYVVSESIRSIIISITMKEMKWQI